MTIAVSITFSSGSSINRGTFPAPGAVTGKKDGGDVERGVGTTARVNGAVTEELALVPDDDRGTVFVIAGGVVAGGEAVTGVRVDGDVDKAADGELTAGGLVIANGAVAGCAVFGTMAVAGGVVVADGIIGLAVKELVDDGSEASAAGGLDGVVLAADGPATTGDPDEFLAGWSGDFTGVVGVTSEFISGLVAGMPSRSSRLRCASANSLVEAADCEEYQFLAGAGALFTGGALAALSPAAPLVLALGVFCFCIASGAVLLFVVGAGDPGPASD